MKTTVIFAVLLFGSGVSVHGQKNFNITTNSAGGIKLGMTVDQARRTLPSCRFKRTSDAEGLTLIGVRCSGRQIITIFAGEEDVDAPVNGKAKIEFIEVWDKRFKTNSGVHKGMLVRDVEKRLGRVVEIVLTQTESREFVTFRKQQKGISYRTYGGIYPPGMTKTTKYERGAEIWSIQVSRY